MANKYLRVLSIFVAFAAISAAVVSMAANVPATPARAGEGGVCLDEFGNPEAAGEGQACAEDCRGQYQACLAQASQIYQTLLEGCKGVQPGTAQAQCYQEAAKAYSLMVQACKDAYNACVEACGRGR